MQVARHAGLRRFPRQRRALAAFCSKQSALVSVSHTYYCVSDCPRGRLFVVFRSKARLAGWHKYAVASPRCRHLQQHSARSAAKANPETPGDKSAATA